MSALRRLGAPDACRILSSGRVGSDDARMISRAHVALALVLVSSLACGRSVELEGEGGGVGQGGSGTADAATATTGGGASGQGGAGASGQGGAGASAQGGGGEGGATVTICAAQGPCANCVAEACPEVWCGCVDNPECGALFVCSNACGADEACRQACLSEHPEGISDVVLSTGCAAESCADACPTTGDGLNDCETCLYTDCDEVMNACLSQPACLGLFQCLGACPDLALSCQQGCYADFGEGTEALEAVLGCAQAECSGVCDT
jgi:hypothetical protein